MCFKAPLLCHFGPDPGSDTCIREEQRVLIGSLFTCDTLPQLPLLHWTPPEPGQGDGERRRGRKSYVRSTAAVRTWCHLRGKPWLLLSSSQFCWFVGDLLAGDISPKPPQLLHDSLPTSLSLLGWPVSASGTGLVGPVSFQGSQSLAVIWGVLPAPWMTPISPTSGENAICFPFSSLYYPLLRLVSSASRFGFLQALCPPNPGEHLLNFPKHSLWSHNSLGFLQSASNLLWDRWARLRGILLLTSAFTSPPLPSYTYFE